MPAPPTDPEFALLAAATARPAAEHHAATIAAAADRAIDWQRFLRLVDRHRIAPLAYDGVAAIRDAVPADVLGALRGRAMRDRTAGLGLVGVLATAMRVLAEAGIDAVSIKGPTLAQIAFGDPSLRQSKDLDLLIAPAAVERALAAMIAAGFRIVIPTESADAEQLRLWARLMKDCSLVHDPSGAQVELHWRLNNNPYLMAEPADDDRTMVAIGSLEVPTLGERSLLLYLCIHGARHGWIRLKWLADVHALLAARGAEGIERFHAHARAQGLDPPAGQMLLLLRDVYGLALPAKVAAAAERSPRVRLLVWIAHRLMLNPREQEEVRFASTLISIAAQLLRRGPRYVAREAAGLLVDWPMLLRLGATRRAYAVTILGRPLFWLIRKTRSGRPPAK